MKITGKTKITTGYNCVYKVEFNADAGKTKKFKVFSTSSYIYFAHPNGRWLNSPLTISCEKNTSTFTFEIIGTKEYKCTLTVTDETGGESVSLNIEVSLNSCTISIDPSNIKINDTFTCNCKMPSPLNNKIYNVVGEWSTNSDVITKHENSAHDGADIVTQRFKAVKKGEATISTMISVFDMNNFFPFDFCKGTVKVNVKSPYSVTLVNNTDYACKNSILQYRVNGLINSSSAKETIKWECNSLGVLNSVQGTNPATFRITSEDGYFEVKATINYNGQDLIENANKKVWIGKPTVSNVITNHSIAAGEELTLLLSEFNHYSGNVEYNIESGLQDKFKIDRLSPNKFKIKSNHPQIIADTIVIRFTASNICGSVSKVHTINIEAGTASSFDKAMDLSSYQDHYIFWTRSYQLAYYAGDIQNFKMYFTFELKRKADITYLYSRIDGDKYQAFILYDEQKNVLYTFSQNESPHDFHPKNMQPGRYYWVVDVKRTNQEETIYIDADGIIKGDYPGSPYEIDVNEDGFEFNDCRDTTYYLKNFEYRGQDETHKLSTGNNIYYVMKLKRSMQIRIDTIGSTVTAEMHIMIGDSPDWTVYYHDDGDPFNPIRIIKNSDLMHKIETKIGGRQNYIEMIFDAGEYKFVFNGNKKTNAGKKDGLINVNIKGVKIKDQSFDNAYELGTFEGHEFTVKQVFNDLFAQVRNGINQLYFHFTTKKYMGIYVKAQYGNSYLPTTIYNSNKEVIASADADYCRIRNIQGDSFYITVNIKNIVEDSFTLNVEGTFRGRLPYDAYVIGSFSENFTFSDSIDTAEQGFYESFHYGTSGLVTPQANHIYYEVTLLQSMELLVNTDGSAVRTEIHVMVGEPYDWWVMFHTIDFRTQCDAVANRNSEESLPKNEQYSDFRIRLMPGKYKFVFNGYKLSNASKYNGIINVNIIGTVIQMD